MKSTTKTKLKKLVERIIKEESGVEWYGCLFDGRYPDDVSNVRKVTAKDQIEALWKYAKRGFGEEEQNVNQIDSDAWAYKENATHVYIVTTNPNITAKTLIPKILKKFPSIYIKK